MENKARFMAILRMGSGRKYMPTRQSIQALFWMVIPGNSSARAPGRSP
jgi:hypothetical protein